jgi:hypothetical protein
MDEVVWARDSKYFCYLYQTTTSFCNTILIRPRDITPMQAAFEGDDSVYSFDHVVVASYLHIHYKVVSLGG